METEFKSVSTNGGMRMSKRNKKLHGVKNVIWDLDNTIWIHREDEYKMVSEFFNINDCDKMKEQYYKIFSAYDFSFRNKKVKKEKFKAIVKYHMPILEEHGIGVDEFMNSWMTLRTNYLNDGVCEILKYLKKRNYKNYVLSDWFEETQLYNLKEYGILDYFEEISASDNQYLKANPKSDGRIVDSQKKDEYVIIGDSLASDIAFANRNQIRSIWYNRLRKENNTELTPTIEIGNLRQIINYL